VAFLFTGQGALIAGMGRNLSRTSGIFRATLDRCDEILRTCGVASVREALDNAGHQEQTDLAQPALFSLEYALAQTWRHWGIEPAALLGHSVGEYVAACLAGVLSLEDALKLIACRGRLMQDCPEGAMLACFAPLEEVQRHVQRWGDCLEIAVINGPEQVVVAGGAAVAAFQEELAAHGIETRLLKVRRAFHSALIEPALPGLRALAATLTHRPPAIPLVSNLSGTFFASAPGPDYWAEHARRTVQFASGIRALREEGITHFLEVGPDAVLSRLGPACLAARPQAEKPDGTVWLSSLQRGMDEQEAPLTSLGRLYLDGAEVCWDRLNDAPHWRRLSLPTYPFERIRYWVDGAPGARPPGRPQPAVPAQPANAEKTHWRPWSNWRQQLPRTATGWAVLNREAGGLKGIVAPLLPGLRQKHPLGQFALLRQEFDRLAGGHALANLIELGWRPQVGEVVQTDQLAVRLQVVNPYDRLLERLLQMAEEDGWLRKETMDSTRRVIRPPFLHDIAAEHTGLLERYPAFATDLRLAHRCGMRMPSVMRGETDPLEVLFGDEAASWTERLYRESPLARFYNDLLAGAVRELVQRLADSKPVRLLEVGGGTAGTTAHVLPLLPPERVEYVFTDVSKVFVAQAALKLRDFPFVHFRSLDLEQAPDVQGFADGQFDLILAANVLHATTDLRQSLRTIRRLLAPEGMLVLLEGTGPRRLLDLIFGLTEGWWKFADLDLRPRYPLLSPSAWEKLLNEEGFTDQAVFPEPDQDVPDPDQAVILALSGMRESASSANGETARQADAEAWTVTCGSFGPGGEKGNQTGRLIDLDPAQTLEERLACLSEALRHPDEQQVVAYRGHQRYIPVQAKYSRATGTEKFAGFDRQVLLTTAPEARRRLIEDYLRQVFQSILGVKLAAEDLDRPPQAFGLDSLMGIQLRNRVEADLGISLSVVDFLKGLSLNQLIDKMLEGLAGPANGAAPARVGAPKSLAALPPSLTSEKVDRLPEESLDALLGSLLRERV
jgi:malonyl CoA-acyl carrier protein transacylase/SAM-dependent methyltransferase